MFSEIFLFELKYRLRRPGFYLYFFLVLAFAIFSFGTGSLPLEDKEMINAPASLALYSSVLSVFLMLVSSAIMGVPLYRDIEHGTKEYYLSYPITKAGYFWGRYLGSFVFVALIGLAVLAGAWLGCKLAPLIGWQPASRYGKDQLINYAYPFLTLILPSLFFTSSLFFGLVAVFRNVKVIYSSGLFLFLGYILANFFLHNIHNPTVIYLTDPFLVNGLRSEIAGFSVEQLNGSIIPLRGLLLENRILWVSVGAVVLLVTYLRFSFERFFQGMADQGRRSPGLTNLGAAGQPVPNSSGQPVGNRSGQPVANRTGQPALPRAVHISLEGSYHRKTLASLIRIELLNIIRDNYFWIILSGGLIFLSFIFFHGPGRYDVEDYPRTVFFMDMFKETFVFFVFLIIIFYTGETVHREKLTRYAFINDSLPPPTWVLNSAKLISLCCLGFFLALTPVILGLSVQLIKGYTWFNLPLYFSTLFSFILPKLAEMVLFCYAIHIVVNNKFAAHGIAITIWTILFVLTNFNYFNYNLLLYSYTPLAWASDTDGIGHMVTAILWFQVYWTLAGGLLVMIGSLFYPRGVSQSFKEKKQLARQRFGGMTRTGITLLLAAYLSVGAYIYYNVSYLNDYITPSEKNERAALVEKQLKRYAGLPLPQVSRIQLFTDLYPEKQGAKTRARVTIVNKDTRPIDSVLIDGDGLELDLRYNGAEWPYSIPLYVRRGKFNLFRPGREASDYRVYHLPAPLRPGDSAMIEVGSAMVSPGFQNTLYAPTILRNGTICSGYLPGEGYDEGDELKRNDVRASFGLLPRKDRDIPQDDPAGLHSPQSDFNGGLVPIDMTVSTSPDQWVVAPGTLEKEWLSGGRHYFHYVIAEPGLYPPYAITSAKYSISRDTVQLDNGHIVKLGIYYQPAQGANLSRYRAALKDGLRYYSQVFGPYPSDQLSLVESAQYGPYSMSAPDMILCAEHNGWNADMRDPGRLDYLYFNTAYLLAQQWWGRQVMPNNTVGSRVISEGLSRYAALCLMERKYGKTDMQRIRQTVGWDYSWGRRRNSGVENDLLHANRGYIQDSKAAMVLCGLAKNIGEDSLNRVLRLFRERWANRNGGPYAGSPDLYRMLEQQVPDSLRYYLSDSWLRVMTYDNRLTAATVTPLGKDSGYRVIVTADVQKRYTDKGGDIVMDDYIDLNVSGKNAEGKTKELARHTYRWSAGQHKIEWIVRQKPVAVEIDPDRKLMDLNEDNNKKEF